VAVERFERIELTADDCSGKTDNRPDKKSGDMSRLGSQRLHIFVRSFFVKIFHRRIHARFAHDVGTRRVQNPNKVQKRHERGKNRNTEPE
jgi:hypothetical protein